MGNNASSSAGVGVGSLAAGLILAVPTCGLSLIPAAVVTTRSIAKAEDQKKEGNYGGHSDFWSGIAFGAIN